ncbi:hypothetical protein O3P69_000500 [Scylla paramamosain]|uniref:Uncharacterized protein n=1 Tax=Scylla paramamosain TaxID=85552 RepID=A0AAW0UTK8_SCYPA
MVLGLARIQCLLTYLLQTQHKLESRFLLQDEMLGPEILHHKEVHTFLKAVQSSLYKCVTHCTEGSEYRLQDSHEE